MSKGNGSDSKRNRHGDEHGADQLLDHIGAINPECLVRITQKREFTDYRGKGEKVVVKMIGDVFPTEEVAPHGKVQVIREGRKDNVTLAEIQTVSESEIVVGEEPSDGQRNRGGKR